DGDGVLRAQGIEPQHGLAGQRGVVPGGLGAPAAPVGTVDRGRRVGKDVAPERGVPELELPVVRITGPDTDAMHEYQWHFNLASASPANPAAGHVSIHKPD